MMFSTFRSLLPLPIPIPVPIARSPVAGDSGPVLPLGQRVMSERLTVSGSDRPTRSLPGPGAKTPDTPLTKRFASLALVKSEAPLTDGPHASAEVCSVQPCTPDDGRVCTLHSALTALASGALCSAAQIATLRKQYGSLNELIPLLGKTFENVDHLQLTDKEWCDVIEQHPLVIFKVPAEVLERCHAVYVQALCSSGGSAAVVALLPAAHKESLCYQAFQKNPALIGLLPLPERTLKRCKTACIREAQALAHVPPDLQTEDFLEQVCKKNSDCFRELADAQKTKKLAMQVCAKQGTLLKEVPFERRDKELCEVACLSAPCVIPLVPEDICTVAFCEHIVDKAHLLALPYVPAGKITFRMCESICERRPDMLEFVPDKWKTEDLFDSIMKSKLCYYAYPHLPLHRVSAAHCRQLCEKYAGSLGYVPDDLKDENLYRIVLRDEFWHLNSIAKAHRTRELCLKSGVGDECDFASVPDDHINLNFLFSVMGGKDDLDLHTRAQNLLPEEHYTTFLCISALYRTKTQLKLLTWPALPDHFRRRLIDFLAGTGEPISVEKLPQHPLTNQHNPLRFHLYNPFVAKLLLQAHTAGHYRPVCQADGQAWLHYLEEQLPRYTDSPLPLIDDELFAPLQRGICEAKGGRTVQVKDGDRIYYYKFQRQDEPLADLVREGLIHQFRAENPQGAWSKLASDLPQDPHFFALPQSMWPSTKEQFKDEVKVHKEDGREPWINVYRYTASADYGCYAHQPDSEADCPWTKPEEAILTACYDMGLFASCLLYTSPSPRDRQKSRMPSSA